MKKAVVFAGIMCAVMMVGCRQKSPPPTEPATGNAPALTSDEKVLLALDAYDPIYQMNSKGRVIKLKLPWRHLSDSMLEEINKLTELEGFDAYGSTLNNDKLKLLKDLQKLRTLGMGSTGVTDEGLAHLQNMRGLHYVWVSKQNVSEEAAAKLSEARPDLTVYRQ
ncbi:hypothetical protein [Zavarzinella formosa]|uniref:hypothetical protein n=1 Tax=Zavarzinella formosa TaxID=360055 RepID=UPI00030F7450|nr:hypothetical protein [Zavarzinella formosa]